MVADSVGRNPVASLRRVYVTACSSTIILSSSKTSTTSAGRERLNLRHLAIIDGHKDILSGARVVDLACHDGRWTFGALEAGAAHVTGIEGRPELVENARKTIAAKGVDPSRYDLRVGDANELLTAGVGQVDVVMCLGFLYHTLRYPELLTGIRATGAKYVLIDSKVVKSTRPIVRLLGNPAGVQSMAVEDRYSYRGKSLVGIPSPKAIEVMLRLFGYEVVRRTDWDQLLRDHAKERRPRGVQSGGRITLLATDTADAADEN